ncbi:MAG: winged helix-turn-helix transcriptional regulator, partial [Oscillospiraceae bacterium]|nr:winged helix-turn-helix transcriptional regulator [Oscillospiraceae bacterium]
RHARADGENEKLAVSGVFTAKGLTIDYNKHWVLVDGENVHLTQNEFKIVSLLGIHAGKVLTYDFILRHLWGPGVSGNNQVLRVHMANIRRKIEKTPAEPEYIFTEVGVGYRMIEPD